VLVATLFAPLLGEQPTQIPRREVSDRLDRMLGEVGGQLGMARRDRERARQILMGIHRMMAKRRRKRSSIVHREYFHDALIFLGVSVGALGRGDSELAFWRALAKTQPPAPAGAKEPARRKRRRRRPRKKKGSKPADRGPTVESERDADPGP